MSVVDVERARGCCIDTVVSASSELLLVIEENWRRSVVIDGRREVGQRHGRLARRRQGKVSVFLRCRHCIQSVQNMSILSFRAVLEQFQSSIAVLEQFQSFRAVLEQL